MPLNLQAPTGYPYADRWRGVFALSFKRGRLLLAVAIGVLEYEGHMADEEVEKRRTIEENLRLSNGSVLFTGNGG
ncbi:MAG: hypothetical protein K5989_02615 [Lachnospiraceae bacterium]|nr:hypothetical protein [Lachnospiraceae bacterium]